MGQTTGELREQIDATRDDASQKIDQIEQMVTGAADQVKDQVERTKEQVKETFDWRHQVEDKPLVALGAAFIGGAVLGGITGGHDHEHHDDRYSYQRTQADGSYRTGQSEHEGSMAGGVLGAVRGAAKKTGLDETFAQMAGGFMAMVSDRVKEMANQVFPGMADKMEGDRSMSTAVPPSAAPMGSSPRPVGSAGIEQSSLGHAGSSAYGASGNASF